MKKTPGPPGRPVLSADFFRLWSGTRRPKNGLLTNSLLTTSLPRFSPSVLVVSDTSPLSYLILIGEGDLLGALYEDVLIPPAVENELKDPDGPVALPRWIEDPPSWLRVKAASGEDHLEIGPETAEALHSLDRGEREAIRLATENRASLLVIDERDGRRVASALGLRITGTVGVLDTAASEGLVEAVSVVDRLRETSFRASSELYEWLVERHA